MGSQSSDTSTVTRNEPPQYLQPVLRDALSKLSGLFGNPGQYPEYYPYSTVAPQSEYSREGAAQGAEAARRQAALGEQTVQAVGNIYNSLDVGNDPYLKRASEAAINPIYKNLSEVILPQIGDQNIVSGTFGGDRQGITQVQAIDATNKQALDTTSLMYANALQNAYGNVRQTAASLPAITTGLESPVQTLFNTGQIMEGYNQRVLNDQIARFAYEQNLPFDMAQRYWGMLSGSPMGGTSTITPPGGGGISPWQGALGGAAAGYSAYPAGGWYSAGAGALLGYLAARNG